MPLGRLSRNKLVIQEFKSSERIEWRDGVAMALNRWVAAMNFGRQSRAKESWRKGQSSGFHACQCLSWRGAVGRPVLKSAGKRGRMQSLGPTAAAAAAAGWQEASSLRQGLGWPACPLHVSHAPQPLAHWGASLPARQSRGAGDTSCSGLEAWEAPRVQRQLSPRSSRALAGGTEIAGALTR